MKKIIITSLFIPSICFSDVNLMSQVHRYCETNNVNEADLIIRIENKKINSRYCIYLDSVCGYVKGKVLVDQKNGVPSYLSASPVVCR